MEFLTTVLMIHFPLPQLADRSLLASVLVSVLSTESRGAACVEDKVFCRLGSTEADMEMDVGKQDVY